MMDKEILNELIKTMKVRNPTFVSSVELFHEMEEACKGVEKENLTKVFTKYRDKFCNILDD